MDTRDLYHRALGFCAHRSRGKRNFSKFENALTLEQDDLFLSIGLNRRKAIEKLNQVLTIIYNQNYSESQGTWSEHLILFAAISESNYQINEILEIGTFNGETARILSALFPSSKIETFDLPYSEILQQKMYKYETDDNKLLLKRNTNLQPLKNVNFMELNSLLLLNSDKKYDLIWIDGDHSYPIVAIDLANCTRLLNEGGIAICDDVVFTANETLEDGRFTASIRTLEKLKSVGLIHYILVSKRIGGQFNFPEIYHKYLGVIRKNSTVQKL
jgi:predicted O-methyltransferase YrrM